MHLLGAVPVFRDIWQGLREALYMFWESLWALVLGFTLSGFVQTFVSRDQMKEQLGDHHAPAVVRASVYGMVSSSCSYAASAMAKSLVAKGADFTSSMIFMIASTNLVVELGVVLVVLVGWQFALGEFIGGPIMIFLLAIFGGSVFSRSLIDSVRRRLSREPEINHGDRGHEERDTTSEVDATLVPRRRLSPAALADAAQYAVSDVTMLRKELAIGYLVAGYLAALVPVSFWNSLFLHGHGGWTSFENAFVGPLVAVISWVCSIGNVPLAAALWSGGISFGGVIAFVFADLISMPLILVYRRLYGWRLTVRIVAIFYPAMAVAGLVTQAAFGAFHAIPKNRSIHISTAQFSWNYTTGLDLFFIVIASLVWWFAGHRSKFGGGLDYAIDPVCKMQVQTGLAPASTSVDGETYWFCSDRCRERFEEHPERYTVRSASEGPREEHPTTPSEVYTMSAIDPICHMTVDPETAAAHRTYEGEDFWFCNPGCAATFDEDPARYAKANS